MAYIAGENLEIDDLVYIDSDGVVRKVTVPAPLPHGTFDDALSGDTTHFACLYDNGDPMMARVGALCDGRQQYVRITQYRDLVNCPECLSLLGVGDRSWPQLTLSSEEIRKFREFTGIDPPSEKPNPKEPEPKKINFREFL